MATLSRAINATERDIDVTAPVETLRGGELIRVDSELMQFAGYLAKHGSYIGVGADPHLDYRRWRVERGVEGTTAASHSSGATLRRAIEAVSSSADLSVPDPFANGGGSGGVVVDNQSDPPAEVTTLVAPGATLDGNEATIRGVVIGSGAPTAPVEGSNEQWELGPGTAFPWAGTFKFAFDGAETPDINVETTTVAEIITMLEGLPGIGAGNIGETAGNDLNQSFTGNGGDLAFEFVGDLAQQDVANVTVTDLAVTRNGSPVNPGDWLVETNNGSPPEPGNPTSPAIGLVYVDTETGAAWVNTGTPESPAWLRASDDQVGEHVAAADPHPDYTTSEQLLAHGVTVNGTPDVTAFIAPDATVDAGVATIPAAAAFTDDGAGNFEFIVAGGTIRINSTGIIDIISDATIQFLRSGSPADVAIQNLAPGIDGLYVSPALRLLGLSDSDPGVVGLVYFDPITGNLKLSL